MTDACPSLTSVPTSQHFSQPSIPHGNHRATETATTTPRMEQNVAQEAASHGTCCCHCVQTLPGYVS